MEEKMFRQKVQLMLDPYFDREFFTNLFYCIDRKKRLREIFEAAVREMNLTETWTKDLDGGLLHLFFSYQVSSLVRENYQWLPISNGLYTASLQRGNGQKPVKVTAL